MNTDVANYLPAAGRDTIERRLDGRSCPACREARLRVREGDAGLVTVVCANGCPARSILAAIRIPWAAVEGVHMHAVSP